MWNLNLLLRAYSRNGGLKQVLLLFISRLVLFNLIASVIYLISKVVSVPLDVLLVAQGVIAAVFIVGFPLMKKVGIAPFDLSPQFLFPERKFPPGVALGLSLPYCSVPFVVLLAVYSLHFKSAFLIFNLYAVFVTLPTLLFLILPDKPIKGLTSLVPAVPALTGFSLVLAMGLFLDFGELNLYVSSLLQEKPSLLFLSLVMFFLGFFTSLGPSTLPFLPVVFGVLVTKHRTRAEIFMSVLGFSVAFLMTHAGVGAIATVGAVVLSQIFRTELFNLILSVLLFFVALNLLKVISLSLPVARLNPFSGAGTSSFVLGVAYTFSLCPSCTSLLLGALVLSSSTGNPLTAVFLMALYAVGRAIPVFLSGLVVSNMSGFIREHHTQVNRAVGFLFLLLAGYFFKNFLEVAL